MTPQARLRLVTGCILGAGLTIAFVIYLTASPETEFPPGYDVTQTKRYRHDMELYGGKANVLMDEYRREFASLWHGKALAGTVACLSVLSVLSIRFVARLRDG
jgi:hypothetical protein